MISKLRVLCGGKPVGQLAEKQGNIVFQYDAAWLRDGFDLAPGSMPFAEGAMSPSRTVFDGLHGVFNDSLPDGWGLLLMDRALKQHRGLDRAVDRWPEFADKHGMAKTRTSEIKRELTRVAKNCST